MNFAVFFDLGAVNISYFTFIEAIESLPGKVGYVKFYGYNAKRNGDYNKFIRDKNASVELPLCNRKKVKVDIRQVVDSISLASSNNYYDGVFVVCAQQDSLPMIKKLKEIGKYVAVGWTSPTLLTEYCDKFVMLDRSCGVENEQSLDDIDIDVSSNIIPLDIIETKQNKIVADEKYLDGNSDKMVYASPIDNNSQVVEDSNELKIKKINSIGKKDNLEDKNCNHILDNVSKEIEDNIIMEKCVSSIDNAINLSADSVEKNNIKMPKSQQDIIMPFTQIKFEEEKMNNIVEQLSGMIKTKQKDKIDKVQNNQKIDIEKLLEKYF